MKNGIEVLRNDRTVGTPLLSVAVPYKDYAVETLAREMILQASKVSAPVEIVFADDGSQDSQHADALQRLFAAAPVPCTLLRCARNVGRAAIRNSLAQEARGTYLLFLDADMLPDAADFLSRYLAHAEAGELDAVCGGRSYRRLTRCPEDRLLYRYFSQTTECVSANVRNQRPFWYLLTNNLMLRRQLLIDQPFDEAYRGWGFEDADWAMRLRGARVLHVENTASHMDLPAEQPFLSKFDESTLNFVRISREIPEFRSLAIYRASALLSAVPICAPLLRRIARRMALCRRIPMRLRYAAVQGYRVATYAVTLRDEANH